MPATSQARCSRAPAPQPWRQRLLAEQAACLARQCTDHLQGQPLASPAIPTGANAARAQTIGRALRCPAVDRLLARSIGLQRLAHEHRQRNRRRIPAVTGDFCPACGEVILNREHGDRYSELLG